MEYKVLFLNDLSENIKENGDPKSKSIDDSECDFIDD